MSGPPPTCRVRAGLGGLITLVMLAVATPGGAVETRRWLEDAGRLKRGDAEGVAVTSQGRMFLTPRPTELGSWDETERDAYVWSMAADAAGNLFLGTGPDGRILRVTGTGATRVLYRLDQPMVTALAVLPGGTLLAGTAPEGKIFRVRADGRGELWSETGASYVWALAVGADGSVYAATGDQGVVYTIDDSGTATPFFDSQEPHVVSLLPRPDGTLLAGGAGRGLIYRVDASGGATVIHDDELPEVRALAARRDGGVVAALVDRPEPERRPPALRIQLPDGSSVAATADLGELEDDGGDTLEGTIEGLTPPAAEAPRALRGRIVSIEPDGVSRELWSSATEAPYSLALDPSGRPVFGTGEPGRLYRVESDREIALLGSVGEAQITGLLRLGSTLTMATSNPAGAYRLDTGEGGSGTFVSRAFDAGATARWGTLTWEVDGPGLRVELSTRTGNSAIPDDTWSEWSPVVSAPGAAIASPDGRFLQWRARLSSGGRSGSQVRHVGFSYAPRNRAPELRDFRLQGERRAVSNEAVLRWSVADPDGDPVAVAVEYRRGDGDEWKPALERSPAFDGDRSAGWRADEGRWTVAELDEGGYELRATASDAPGNPPGAAGRADAETTLMLWVDRTPPELRASVSASRTLEVEVSDPQSTVARLELVGVDGERYRLLPVDGVCDSSVESFRLELDRLDAGFAPRVLRAVDEAGNVTEQPWPSS